MGLAFLTTLGYDNSTSFNPVAPAWPDWQANGPGTRTLEIQGTPGIENGAVLEATVLYDGLEVAGVRSRCPQRAGCRQLELEASVLGRPTPAHGFGVAGFARSPAGREGPAIEQRGPTLRLQ